MTTICRYCRKEFFIDAVVLVCHTDMCGDCHDKYFQRVAVDIPVKPYGEK